MSCEPLYLQPRAGREKRCPMVTSNPDSVPVNVRCVAEPAEYVGGPGPAGNVKAFADWSASLLAESDPALYELLGRELQRQNDTLMMIAAASVAHPSVLACEG